MRSRVPASSSTTRALVLAELRVIADRGTDPEDVAWATATCLAELALIEGERRAWADAEAAARRTLVLYEQLGAPTTLVGHALESLGAALSGRHGPRVEGQGRLLAGVQFALARALPPRARARARRLAEAARQTFGNIGTGGAKRLAEVELWLRTGELP